MEAEGGWRSQWGSSRVTAPLLRSLYPYSALLPFLVGKHRSPNPETSLASKHPVYKTDWTSAPILPIFQLVNKKKVPICTLKSTFLLRISRNRWSLLLCCMAATPPLSESLSPSGGYFTAPPLPTAIPCLDFLLSRSNCLNVLSPFPTPTSYSCDIELSSRFCPHNFTKWFLLWSLVTSSDRISWELFSIHICLTSQQNLTSWLPPTSWHTLTPWSP